MSRRKRQGRRRKFYAETLVTLSTSPAAIEDALKIAKEANGEALLQDALFGVHVRSDSSPRAEWVDLSDVRFPNAETREFIETILEKSPITQADLDLDTIKKLRSIPRQFRELPVNPIELGFAPAPLDFRVIE